MAGQENTRTVLDDVLPEWHRRERHRLAVDAPAPAVIQAARDLTWGEVPTFRRIMAAVSLGRVKFPADAAVLDLFLGNGFEVLHHSDSELVIGGIERVSRGEAVVALGSDPVGAFRAFDRPRHILLGFDFRFADGVLTTETRVRATDARTRKLFGVYWFVIRAGSGFIRHIWLRGIRRRVASGSPGRPAEDPAEH
ncbi:hypothetical protein [Amycolatopsis nigrescens]|uniref:hypothetical protein n=1 Tax=Amycolatopsis nigrescens TaxID=381445 RepID=UPI0003636C61|nr:hypothetical protein [Amycolatopsis nigrescens]